ncbi:type II toxin-antitoxin system VapC family toxin [Amycolatopsis sp. cmx-4-61]|uniref:type II toxin-antitoxin system VapC family toxin n=1 Tax=Amycolatopsis sp. cmx-4-61 TaxID=2790937 RepID=UPI00397C73DA
MANRRDDDHERCTELLTKTPEQLILPEAIVGEIGYMLGTRAGPKAEASFLCDIADGSYIVASMHVDDFVRAAELVEQYADLPLGTADACVLTVAERLGITRIATLDRRHFSIVRLRHAASLTLLP